LEFYEKEKSPYVEARYDRSYKPNEVIELTHLSILTDEM